MEDGQVPSPYLVEELQKAASHFASYALVSLSSLPVKALHHLAEKKL